MLWRTRVLTFYIAISIVAIIFFLFFSLPIKIIKTPYSFRYQGAVLFSYIFIYLMWLICGISFEIEGRNKIPANGQAFIAIANHQSFWENFFLQLIIPIHSWVIKKELLDIPVFGWGLKDVMPIAVNRDDTRSVAYILSEGKKKLCAGISLVMFPEATRVKVTRNVPFKPSAAKLAIESKVPIVLIAHNAGLIWPKGFWFMRSGKIKVTIIEYLSADFIATVGDARSLTIYMENKITTEKNKLVSFGV